MQETEHTRKHRERIRHNQYKSEMAREKERERERERERARESERKWPLRSAHQLTKPRMVFTVRLEQKKHKRKGLRT